MARVSKPTTRRTHHKGERRLLFMIPGTTVLAMSDEEIERLVDETVPEGPTQKRARNSKWPPPRGERLKKGKGP